MEAPTDWQAVTLALCWLIAVLVLARFGLRLPLVVPGSARRRRWWNAGVLAGGACVLLLAVTALTWHDTHLDLTREKRFTPSAQAMTVVAGLREPVKLTYFFQGQDPNALRARDLLLQMAKLNPLLAVDTIDPEKQPSLAATRGVKVNNAALIEAQGRRVLVQGTDEAEFAVGIQRVLRERVVKICFTEGHNEYSIDNEEFHTHLDSAASHSHDDAASKVIETTGHGIGRLRRSLEALGYDVARVPLATQPDVPATCAVLIAANPRTTWLPGESASVRRYLERGGAFLLLADLGFELEPGLAGLLADMGVKPQQAVVVDRLSHYGNDAEMVAVTGYEPHPLTAKVAYSFFPGVRPLELLAPAAGVTVRPLAKSGESSTIRAVAAVERRLAGRTQAPPADDPTPAARVLAAASEGRLGAASAAFRAVVVGDADFASNSFYPYMANSDLTLSMVRWLVREEALVAVNARVAAPPLVLLTASQVQAVYLVTTIALPLLAVLMGLIAWWRRR